MIFAIEPIADIWDDVFVLGQKHWLETQQYRHNQTFNPSLERYGAFEQSGMLYMFTARDDGRLVGYGGLYVTSSMHTQARISTEDTWYMLPEYRRGWNGIRFFKYMEDFLRKMDVVETTLTVPVTKDARHGHMLERLGYTPVAVKYSKSLVRADSPSDQRAVEETPVCAQPIRLMSKELQ